MDWDAVGAIAEGIGVLVVIASLFYVAAQIKQNSALLKQNGELARAAMIHETNESATLMDQMVAQSAELASILLRGKTRADLDEVEQTRYLALVGLHLTWLEDIDTQHHAGLFIDDEDGPDPVEDMLPHYGDLLRPEFVQRWWASGANYFFSIGFRKKIERIMADDWKNASA